MEPNPHHTLWAGFALGAAFGAVAQISRFCLLRGLRQWRGLDEAQRHGGAPALQAFALALVVALVGSQWLAFSGQIDWANVPIVRARFSVTAVFIGGAVFGVGMVLARSCGARALVLLGGGNLRALVTLVALGMAAQASLTGVLAPARNWLQSWGAVTLEQSTLPAMLQSHGLSSVLAVVLASAVPVLALLAYALWQPALRRSPRECLGALLIGALVATGWWISANVGVDPFEPIPTTSLSFVGPVADTQLYLQMSIGRKFSLGAAIVVGTLTGAMVAALVTGKARWEGFDSPRRLAASVVGGLLMGFGGVVAVGCTIGQGLSGLSALAFASVPAVLGIVAGALLMLGLRPRA
jgi:hypothetical protein